MKKFILLVFVMSVVGYLGWQQKQMVYSILGIQTLPAPAAEIQNQIEKTDYITFDLSGESLDDFAIEGSHSIVIVTATNCTQCDEAESTIDSIIEKRKDVAVKKISMNKPVFNINSVEEIRFQKKLLDKFGVTTLPIVRIYNPEKENIASDNMSGEEGESFIEFWKNAELEALQN